MSATQFSGGDALQENLVADMLLNPKGFAQAAAANRAARATANQILRPESNIHKQLRAVKYGTFGGLIQAGGTMTTDISSTMANYQYQMNRAGFYGKELGRDIIEGGARILGFDERRFGIFNRGNIGSVEQGFNRLYGASPVAITARDQMLFDRTSTTERMKYVPNVNRMGPPKPLALETGIDANNLIRNMSREGMQYLLQTIGPGLANNASKELLKDNMLKQYLNLTPDQMSRFQASPITFLKAAGLQIVEANKSISKKSNEAATYADNYLRTKITDETYREKVENHAQQLTKQESRAYREMDALRTGYMSRKGSNVEDYDKRMAGQVGQARYNEFMAWKKYNEAEMGSRFSGLDISGTFNAAASLVDLETPRRAANLAARDLLGLKRTGGGPFKTSGKDIGYNISRLAKVGKAIGLPGATAEDIELKLMSLKGIGEDDAIITDLARVGYLKGKTPAERLQDLRTKIDVLKENKDLQAYSVAKVSAVVRSAFMVMTGNKADKDLSAAERATSDFLFSNKTYKELPTGVADVIAKGNVMQARAVTDAFKTGGVGAVRAFVYDKQDKLLDDASLVKKIETAMADKTKMDADWVKKNLPDGLAKQFNATESTADIKDKILPGLRARMQTAQDVSRSQGNTLNATINPPILNYWNNSWAY